MPPLFAPRAERFCIKNSCPANHEGAWTCSGHEASSTGGLTIQPHCQTGCAPMPDGKLDRSDARPDVSYTEADPSDGQPDRSDARPDVSDSVKPWSIRGVPPEERNAAIQAAKRAG